MKKAPQGAFFIFTVLRAPTGERRLAGGKGLGLMRAQAQNRGPPTVKEPTMAYTIFDATVPVFQQTLSSLLALLDRVEAHAADKCVDPSTLLNASLAPDMFNCIRQVQIATDHAKGCVARLAGMDIPRFEDSEKTIDELRARIRKTLDFIATVTPAQLAGAEDKELKLVFPWATYEFTGRRMVGYWSLPNFFFHVTTAYDILRHKGVPLGKSDFLGPL